MYSGVLGTLAACSSARELDPRLPGCKGLLLCRIICILGTGEHAKCPSQELISGPTLNPSLCYLHNTLVLLVSLCDQQQKQNPDFCLNSSKAENHKKEKKKQSFAKTQDIHSQLLRMWSPVTCFSARFTLATGTHSTEPELPDR